MNIRNNIIDYLYDKENIIAMYDNSIYIFNFLFLNEFSDNSIIISFKDRKINIRGSNLRIVKVTKEELLIKGRIDSIGVEYKDEK